MKDFLSQIRGAVMATVVLAIACCGLYPLAVLGIGQALFRDRANGSLIVDKDGAVRGSRLLGQNFSGQGYFHPRPSAAGNGYDAVNSSGSNLGPTSQKLHDAIKGRIEAYRKENDLKETEFVPADAVTASGSGLDPHISLRNAEIQSKRVARVRQISDERIRQLIQQYTSGRDLGVFGDSGVNVLTLNLALDALVAKR
jgi:K+-transporting ATPase ATPase C chain